MQIRNKTPNVDRGVRLFNYFQFILLDLLSHDGPIEAKDLIYAHDLFVQLKYVLKYYLKHKSHITNADLKRAHIACVEDLYGCRDCREYGEGYGERTDCACAVLSFLRP